jgi:hypothetical protein
MSLYTIRASALPGWNDCPRRQSISMFWKIITAAGFKFERRENHVGAAIGTGVHAGAAHALREKRDGRALIPIKDVVEIGITAYRKEIAEGVIYDAASPHPNACEKQVENLSRAFLFGVFPDIDALELEAEMLCDLDSEFSPYRKNEGHFEYALPTVSREEPSFSYSLRSIEQFFPF